MAKPKKRRWYHNFADAIKLVAQAEPWSAVAMGAALIGGIGLGVGIGWWYGHAVYGGFLGFLIGLVGAMLLLTWRVRRVSYRRIDGQPGAAMAVLDQIKRGWSIEQEPVAVTRSQDLVFRMVGRPGIVLVSEGPSSRVKRMLNDEERKAARVAPNVPIVQVQVGNAEGQVTLIKLQRHIRKLPRRLSPAEVAAVANRLRSLGGMNLPIPKGIDPTRARPDRKAQRGR